MTRDEAHNGKSCGPQLFADGEPSEEWGLEELSTFAQMQYRQILDGEKLLAPAYWRLGQALALAKRQSMRYEEKIVRLINDTKRDIDRVDWRGEAHEMLVDALTHVDSRLQIEQNIIHSALEKLDLLEDGDEQRLLECSNVTPDQVAFLRGVHEGLVGPGMGADGRQVGQSQALLGRDVIRCRAGR